MNNSKKKILKMLIPILTFSIVFIFVYKIIPPDKDCYYADFTAGAEYESTRINNSVIAEGKAEDLYRITPFMSMKSGEYTIRTYYKTDVPVALKACLMAEYDTNADSYPVIEVGILDPKTELAEMTFLLDYDTSNVIFAVDYKGEGSITLDRCTVESSNTVYNNAAVVAGVSALVSAVFMFIIAGEAMSDDSGKNQRIMAVIAVMLTAVIASAGLISHDVIIADDCEFHFLRIMGIAQNIAGGAPFCKVNFAFNGGYGYLNPVFYPQMFLWIPAVLVILGASVTKAYALFIFILNIATAVISYIFFGKITENREYAVICAVIYTLNHYRLRDIYARAAVGELLFIAFLPIVMYGIYAVFHGKEDKWYVLMLGCCAVFQSHILGTVLTAMLGGMTAAAYMLIGILQRKNIFRQLAALIKAFAGVVLLNLWFLIPMLYYIRQDFGMFTHTDYVNIFMGTARPVSSMLFRLTDLEYGDLYSRTGLYIGIVFASLIAFAFLKAIKKRRVDDGMMFLLFACLFIIAASDIMPWRLLRQIKIVEMLMSKLQFSFRFVTLFIASLTMACALFLSEFGKKELRITWAVALCMMICGAMYYALPFNAISGHGGEYPIFGTSPPEYLMNGAAYHEERARTDKFRTDTDDLKIVSYERVGGGLSVSVENTGGETSHMEIPLLYYAGYEAKVSRTGRKLKVAPGEHMTVNIEIPPGETGEVTVVYRSLKIFRAAEAISLISAVIFMIYSLKKKKFLFTK